MSEAALAPRIRAGEVAVAARLMRDIDDGRPSAEAELRALYPSTGQALVVGVTGPPGAGKSTLVDGLIARFREEGARVGVVAIDPSSPITGGAILGDRVRMQRHAGDDKVFIRSLATRGQLGGLSRATADTIVVLDALGCEVVLVETVGVGQDEVDVFDLVDTAVVVTVPGLGDDVQAIKAGLFEIADLFVVNKADRSGADRVVHDLEAMLSLRQATPSPPEIVRSNALSGNGVDEVRSAIRRHQERQRASGGFEARRLGQARARVRAVLRDRLRARAETVLARWGGLDALGRQVAERRLDPYAAAAQVLGPVPPET